MVLNFSIKKIKNKKTQYNIKYRKHCSLHTKKKNNTNKLMQISYHSILTKIQKLQNYKKKKKKNFKKFFSSVPGVPTDTPEIDWYARYMADTPGI